MKFLSPFSDARYTFVWHPIDPSGAAAGQEAMGQILSVIGNELAWVILPCAVFALLVTLVRSARTARRSPWPG